ncbi:MAG: threonine aldolase [Candidatus Azotimanducaceae bacterium]|jgi:threonine aldolase
MREAMLSAPVGDDVYGEDPTVNELEAYAAALTGKEAALFAASGTQTNLLGILSHCQRGHEYIVGRSAHTYQYEGGGAAVLGSIQPYPIAFDAAGGLPLDEVEAAIKPDDFHFAITRLVCLENTQAGKVLDLAYLRAFSDMTQKHGLMRHLDGARAFNAAVAQNVGIGEICQFFDTASLCLSKGLGSPIGSLLVGDAKTIHQARRWRKMLGGGMRQAGIIAAAGLYALKSNVNRLAQDHDNARYVSDSIKSNSCLTLAEEPQTNMVLLDDQTDLPTLKAHMAQHGVRISGTRWVFHLDISDLNVEQIVSAVKSYHSEQKSA